MEKSGEFVFGKDSISSRTLPLPWRKRFRPGEGEDDGRNKNEVSLYGLCFFVVNGERVKLLSSVHRSLWTLIFMEENRK